MIDDGKGAGWVACCPRARHPDVVHNQALTTRTPYAFPRHRSMGVQLDRVALLLAVLHRHGRRAAPTLSALLGCDVFVNVSGGLRVTDPSSDLSVGSLRGRNTHLEANLSYTAALCSQHLRLRRLR